MDANKILEDIYSELCALPDKEKAAYLRNLTDDARIYVDLRSSIEITRKSMEFYQNDKQTALSIRGAELAKAHLAQLQEQIQIFTGHTSSV